MDTMKLLVPGVILASLGFASFRMMSDGQSSEAPCCPLLPPAEILAPEPSAAQPPPGVPIVDAIAPIRDSLTPHVPDSAPSAPAPMAALPTIPQPALLPQKGKKQWQDPEARAALALVGVDPTAEDYWTSAINNTDLPPNERKDLIEDLNEVGIDPNNLTGDDVRVIEARIRIIERNLPLAMDKTNSDALAEAHKDLRKMLSRFQ